MWTTSCLRITLLPTASLTSGGRQGTSILGTYMDGTRSTKTFPLASGLKWLPSTNLLRYICAGFTVTDSCILFWRLCGIHFHTVPCSVCFIICVPSLYTHVHTHMNARSINFLNYWRVRCCPEYLSVCVLRVQKFSDMLMHLLSWGSGIHTDSAPEAAVCTCA